MGQSAKNRTVAVPFDRTKGLKGVERFARATAKLRDSGKADHVSLSVDDAAALGEFLEDAFDAAVADARAGQPTIPHEVVVAMHGGTHPVRAWRKFRKLTLQQVADRAEGVPVGYLSEIETGKKSGSIDAYKALAKALDADISVLIPD